MKITEEIRGNVPGRCSVRHGGKSSRVISRGGEVYLDAADIAIVGGGLLGRCLAWRASKAGACVALYDAGSSREKAQPPGRRRHDRTNAEAVDGSAQIASMGRHSLALWPLWLAELPIQVFYRDSGTILLGTRGCREAVRTERMLAARHPTPVSSVSTLRESRNGNPLLGHDFRAPVHSDDAQVDNRAFLRRSPLL